MGPEAPCNQPGACGPRSQRQAGPQYQEAVYSFIERYRKYADMFAKMPVLEMARYQVHRLQRITPVSTALLKAERATPIHTLEQLTVATTNRGVETGTRIFKENKPLLTRLSSAQGARGSSFAARVSEESFAGAPALLRAGTGPWTWDSRSWVQDRLRCAITSCISKAMAGAIRSFCKSRKSRIRLMRNTSNTMGPHHQGQRVADGQRAMQFLSDPFLGWTTIGHRQYLVRQLNDHKASIEVDDLKGLGLVEYAEMCGELLARGHSRSGDACILAGYLGSGRRFAEAIVKFAEAYADQTERDWQTLLKSRHAPKKAATNSQIK